MLKNVSSTKLDIYHLYQPLFSLTDWTIYGYESLLRTPKQKDPQLIFNDAAYNNNRLYEIDTLSINHTFSTFNFRNTGFLFVNVYPSTLCNNNFKNFLDALLIKYIIPKNRVVFEINENSRQFKKLFELNQMITFLRDHGFLIALDDIRIDSSSLEQIRLFEPDYIKLDKFFSKNLSTSKKKQQIIQKFVAYCHGKSTLVLEGIEVAQDLAMAKCLGVHVGQGFLLGEPEELR